MPTKLYRFHCTDRHELVTDLMGSRQLTDAQMLLRAEQIPLGLMARVTERFDWWGWQADVYDAKGRRVWVTAFVDVDLDRAAA